MHKRLEAIEVYVDKDRNQICIAQDDVGGGAPIIGISPEQLDVVIEWLKEAREELAKGL
jgi:hypothetical protein